MKFKKLNSHGFSHDIILVLLVVLFAIAGVGYLVFRHADPLLSFNPADVPPITANPVQLNQIFAISQFRSDAGHDYSAASWDGETCRSMKSYYNFSQDVVNNVEVRSKPTPGHPNIDIYAPFDGTITYNAVDTTPLGTQVHIASAKDPSFYVILFHIDLSPSLHIGSHVTSGQMIATIGPMDEIDVAYEAKLFPSGKVVYMSIFNYMTSAAFAPYAALGHKPSDFVLTRAEADAKHYQCNGQSFVRTASQKMNMLEGYVSLRANPYQYLYDNQSDSSSQSGSQPSNVNGVTPTNQPGPQGNNATSVN